MNTKPMIFVIVYLIMTNNLLISQDNQSNDKIALMRKNDVLFSHYCKTKYLVKETKKIAQKIDVDLSGWNIAIAGDDDEYECGVHLKSKTFTIGQGYLNNKKLLPGLITHELGHIKHDKNWHVYTANTVGFIGGFVLSGLITKKVKSWFFKNIIDTSSAVFSAKIGTNLYKKYDEYRADTTSIQFLKNENDYKGLMAMSKFFTDQIQPIENVLGDYGTEIADTLISALSFEKIHFLGGHPTDTSRARRFQKAAQEIKIKEI